MTVRNVEDYLQDIIDYAEKAERFLADYPALSALDGDERTLLAVTRALEIIGEAAKRIPAGLRTKYPAIPWHDRHARQGKPRLFWG